MKRKEREILTFSGRNRLTTKTGAIVSQHVHYKPGTKLAPNKNHLHV